MRTIILASAAFTGLAGPSLAQSSVTASVDASVTFTQSQPTLTVDQGLRFSDIQGETNQAGTQTVGTADNRSARLSYDSRGVQIARSITLPSAPVNFGPAIGSGGQMTLTAFESNFGQGQQVGGATGGFNVGATLTYPANVPATAYTGAFDVIVNFQ